MTYVLAGTMTTPLALAYYREHRGAFYLRLKYIAPDWYGILIGGRKTARE